tara:strand:- start:2205 stop:2324 length:120 start_codon:yes stop_codon:yes gene_type:complete
VRGGQYRQRTLFIVNIGIKDKTKNPTNVGLDVVERVNLF